MMRDMPSEGRREKMGTEKRESVADAGDAARSYQIFVMSACRENMLRVGHDVSGPSLSKACR
jgi:hypothetical protein